MLRAALEVFLARGYERATLDELARASGVTKRTIYADYGDKSGLFVAMVEDLAEAISSPPESDDDTLEMLAARIVLRIHSDELVGLHRLVISVEPRFPELARAFYERTDDRHIRALRAHLASSHGDDTEAVAVDLFSLLLGERHRRRLLGAAEAVSGPTATEIARDAIGRLGLDPAARVPAPAPANRDCEFRTRLEA